MSDIAKRLQDAAAQLLQVGASHEMTTASVNGIELKVYKNAPASLREAVDVGRAFGDKDFIVYEQERWSFNRFFAEADRMGHALVHDYGIGKGDRVAIAMRNYPEWMAAYIAIISIGAIVVPLNSWGQAEELEYGVTDCGAKVLFCDQQRHDFIAARLAELGVQAILVRPDGEFGAQTRLWTDIQQQTGDVEMPAADISPDDLVMIMYTSGTTGNPKGAASTNRAICQALHNFDFQAYTSAMANPEIIGKMMASGNEPSNLLVVPLFHVSGCFAVFLLNLRGGRKTAIMYKWNPEQALEMIEKERLTTFTGVPAMNLALLESPAWETTDTSSLFALGSGGAACPPHLAKLIDEKMPNAYAGTGYGMTESNASGASCTGEAFRAKPGTSGTISPIIDIKTVDENGADLPRGETGEIYLKSPTNVSEYWNLPEASAETFREGWLATGDVGYVDEEGFLFVVDRIKDMVIRGGENIYPIEIESCMVQHPDVVEVSVYGVPHDSLGEELGATVYSSNTELDPQQLKSWVGERLAGFKVPTYLDIQAQELPKNATGKILKKQVRQAFLDAHKP
jgi:acyl-CoA synthetase (AMP-forming)/AMP-acid ligase II